MSGSSCLRRLANPLPMPHSPRCAVGFLPWPVFRYERLDGLRNAASWRTMPMSGHAGRQPLINADDRSLGRSTKIASGRDGVGGVAARSIFCRFLRGRPEQVVKSVAGRIFRGRPEQVVKSVAGRIGFGTLADLDGLHVPPIGVVEPGVLQYDGEVLDSLAHQHLTGDPPTRAFDVVLLGGNVIGDPRVSAVLQGSLGGLNPRQRCLPTQTAGATIQRIQGP